LSSRVPDPPPPDLLQPLLFSWRKGRLLVRCHNARFESASFNPGMGSGRFHPFDDAEGNVVPILYAAEHPDGALAETVFHDVPVRGPAKRIRRSSLKPLVLSALSCSRDLNLAQLFGFGLRRLGVTRPELIEASKGSTHGLPPGLARSTIAARRSMAWSGSRVRTTAPALSSCLATGFRPRLCGAWGPPSHSATVLDTISSAAPPTGPGF
jgi:hypothetical protein